jgi:hypothetical protein
LWKAFSISDGTPLELSHWVQRTGKFLTSLEIHKKFVG